MMHTMVPFGFVFVVMMTGVVVARPEPLPMFLVNRAIKSAVRKVDQDVPSTLVAEEGLTDILPTVQSLDENSKAIKDDIFPVGISQVASLKYQVEIVPAASDLVSILPLAPKSDDSAGSEISLDHTEVNSPTEKRANIGDADQTNNNVPTSIFEGSDPREEKKSQTTITKENLSTKKAPTTNKSLKSKKISKVPSLGSVRLLERLIDTIFDSLMQTNDHVRRDRRSNTFEEYFDYAFPLATYGFNYLE